MLRIGTPAWLAALTLCLAAPTNAWAQDDDTGEADEEEATESEEVKEESEEASDEPAEGRQEKADEAPETEGGRSKRQKELIEESGETYRFVGARYRGIIVPAFIPRFFADGGRTVYVNAFGPEFSSRKDNFEIGASVWFAKYYMPETPFKGKNDGNDAWEFVKVDLWMIYLTTDILWSSPLSNEWAINYGVGVGLGFTAGNVYRNQIYPPANDPNGTSDPSTWTKCDAVGVPNPNFCNDNNDHYGDYTEPSWFNGGSKPSIFPWIALQTGVRYKPHKNFVARLDLGLGTSGFFFGLGADYGI